MATNITAVMLTRNEEDNILDTLSSAKACFDELVLVDASDDSTVERAREWCNERGKAFEVLHSSEREYLLEGPGVQRRRGEALRSNDYTLALGADVRVEVEDPEWFQKDFKHYAYSHTRVRQNGKAIADWRLHQPEPDWGDGGQPRWRGMIHEELRSKEGGHVSEVYNIAEAPMVHRQQRHGAMDVHLVQGNYKHSHDPRSGGNNLRALKKQHYLLRTAVGTENQHRYLANVWGRYLDENRELAAEHYDEIRSEFDLPHLASIRDNPKNQFEKRLWDRTDGEPLMDPEPHSLKEKLL